MRALGALIKHFGTRKEFLNREKKLLVFGKGEWKNAASVNLPEKYGQILTITSSTEDAVYLSDDPDTTVKNAAKNQFFGKTKYNHQKRPL